MRNLFVTIVFCLLAFSLVGCQSTILQQGQANFKMQNYGLAFQQLLPLAKHGDPDAAYAVGYMYYYGLGTIADKIAAVKWMRLAAKHHNVAAQQALAMVDNSLWHALPNKKNPQMFSLTSGK